ncbi:hypothetical protein BLNAU_14682 [Blattamonas nauphoetae]|uniref:Uncharacterized protein n=1 Tax=Blattamonas nauphoetae TaxID=2049346 RepID=A0ABQ9XCV9_9EUKA|nr:hypothetical protein BLNAU_14682 [Blattamonas nauphoetae]
MSLAETIGILCRQSRSMVATLSFSFTATLAILVIRAKRQIYWNHRKTSIPKEFTSKLSNQTTPFALPAQPFPASLPHASKPFSIPLPHHPHLPTPLCLSLTTHTLPLPSASPSPPIPSHSPSAFMISFARQPTLTKTILISSSRLILSPFLICSQTVPRHTSSPVLNDSLVAWLRIALIVLVIIHRSNCLLNLVQRHHSLFGNPTLLCNQLGRHPHSNVSSLTPHEGDFALPPLAVISACIDRTTVDLRSFDDVVRIRQKSLLPSMCQHEFGDMRNPIFGFDLMSSIGWED